VTLTGVDGAALTAVTDRGDPATLVRAGPLSARVTELQLMTGQGPGPDAVAEHRPVSGPDLSAPSSRARWPGFAPAAVELGVAAVFAFPLLAGASCCGALVLLRHRPGPLTPTQLRDALGLADTGLWALLDTRAGVPVGEPAEAFGGGQDEVFQASGMISVQAGVGVDEALVRLRAHAYAHDRRTVEVARDVIARRVRFDPVPGPHG
jgi:hypothetical protein